MRAKEPQAHGNDGDSQAVRHFLRRVMQYIAQQTRLAKIGRKLHDGICQKPSHFAARAALLGILLVCGDAAAERFVVRPSRFFQRRHFAVAPVPQQIDGSIRPDARKPGPKVVRRFILLPGELLEPHPRFEQCFLAYIFGIGSVAREATRAPVQLRHVRGNHLGKRFAVSAPRLRQQLPTGQRAALETESEGCRAHLGGRDGSPSATGPSFLMSHRMNSLAVAGMASGLSANDRFWDALSRKRSGTIWYWTPKLLEVSVQLRAARFVPFRFVGSAGLIQALTDEPPQGCRTVRLL